MGEVDQVIGSTQFERIDLPILRDLAVASKKGLVTKTIENLYYYCIVSYDGTVHSTECIHLVDVTTMGSFNSRYQVLQIRVHQVRFLSQSGCL